MADVAVSALPVVTLAPADKVVISDASDSGDAKLAARSDFDTSLLSKLAGQVLGGHRAVWIDTDDAVYYADNALPSADRVAGITTGAAGLAASVAIQMQGEIVEPTWAWTPGPVYLGAAGALTQVAPIAGAVAQVGVATAPTKLLVRPEPAIVLV